jgi:hypothetical protein
LKAQYSRGAVVTASAERQTAYATFGRCGPRGDNLTLNG